MKSHAPSSAQDATRALIVKVTLRRGHPHHWFTSGLLFEEYIMTKQSNAWYTDQNNWFTFKITYIMTSDRRAQYRDPHDWLNAK